MRQDGDAQVQYNSGYGTVRMGATRHSDQGASPHHLAAAPEPCCIRTSMEKQGVK
jgi:hypothetical protein